MAKFSIFTAFAAAACALAGVQAQNSTATKPPCVAVDFTTKTADITSLNSVIDIAMKSGLLTTSIPDPILVNDTNVSTIPFNLLNLKFDLIPHINSIKINGVPNIVVQHLNVTSANSLAIAAGFNGTLGLDISLKVTIQQLDLKWYSICWTDAIHTPFTCPPAVFDVNVKLSMVKPTVAANAQLNLVGCAPGVAKSVCTDVTITDILSASVTQQFAPLLTRILQRFTSAQILDVSIGWDKITQLDIVFTNKGGIFNSILDALIDFTVDKVNKMGSAYKTVIDVTQKVIKSVLNKVLSTELAKQFGNSCYEKCQLSIL
jgi:hypothetical protein|uniref:Lipid-binding serum glycoprotein N-terminal domain-containing protein n=1 Tax=Globisporangium ultimum (strain ATCC 200006 / CBS 805.95 / DAOM BR144) TaxID=431595 RepID=K3WP02_GLOUD